MLKSGWLSETRTLPLHDVPSAWSVLALADALKKSSSRCYADGLWTQRARRCCHPAKHLRYAAAKALKETALRPYSLGLAKLTNCSTLLFEGAVTKEYASRMEYSKNYYTRQKRASMLQGDL